MKLETDCETIARMLACHNAFHSEDGREIATEKITEGLLWDMLLVLGNVVRARSPETIQAARALLAKLEAD